MFFYYSIRLLTIRMFTWSNHGSGCHGTRQTPVQQDESSFASFKKVMFFCYSKTFLFIVIFLSNVNNSGEIQL